MVSATKVLLTFAAGAVAQNAAAVGQDLKNVDAAVQVLVSKVQSLNGQVGPALQVVAAATTLDASISKASADASAVPGTANDADTNSLLAIVTGPLASDISAAVTAIQTKKTAVPTNQYQAFKVQLSSLYTSASGLAGQLVTKAAAAEKGAATSASNGILSNIGRVTALFN